MKAPEQNKKVTFTPVDSGNSDSGAKAISPQGYSRGKELIGTPRRGGSGVKWCVA